jgi:hypothetical protein
LDTDGINSHIWSCEKQISDGWVSSLIYEPPLLFSIEQDHMEIALLLLAQGERLDVKIRKSGLDYQRC